MADEFPIAYESQPAESRAEKLEKSLVIRQARQFAEEYWNDPDGPEDWPTRIFAIVLAQTGNKRKAIESYKAMKDYTVGKIIQDEASGKTYLELDPKAKAKYKNRVARWRQSRDLEQLPRVKAFIEKIRQDKIMTRTTNELEVRGMLVNQMRGNLGRCFETIPGEDDEHGKVVFAPQNMDYADWATVKKIRQKTRTYTQGKGENLKEGTETEIEIELHDPQTAQRMLMEHMGMTQKEPSIKTETLNVMLFGEPQSKPIESREVPKPELPDAIPTEG